MKKLIVAAVACLGFAGIAFAARTPVERGELRPPASSGEASTVPTPKRTHVRGVIESLDRNTLRLRGLEKALRVDATTKISRQDGAAISLGDLMEGEEIRASFTAYGDVGRVDQLVVTKKRQAAEEPRK